MRSTGFSGHFERFGAGVALLAAVILTAGSASAAGVTFPQYTQTAGGDQQWTVTDSTGLLTTVPASGTVNFTFSGVPGAPGGQQVANFLFSATRSTAGITDANSVYSEAGFSGMFSPAPSWLTPSGERADILQAAILRAISARS